jgi:hypothetical protein
MCSKHDISIIVIFIMTICVFEDHAEGCDSVSSTNVFFRDPHCNARTRSYCGITNKFNSSIQIIDEQTIVIKKFETITISVDANNYSITDLAYLMNKRQIQKYGNKNYIEIRVNIDDSWFDPIETPMSGYDIFDENDIKSIRWNKRVPSLPMVNLYMKNSSLCDITKEIANQIPYYFRANIFKTYIEFKLLRRQQIAD